MGFDFRCLLHGPCQGRLTVKPTGFGQGYDECADKSELRYGK